MRTVLGWVLLVVWLAGLVVMLASFHADYRIDDIARQKHTTERLTIGFPWPWFDWTADELETPDGGRRTVTGGLRPASPAWLVLAAVVSSGYGLLRLNRKPAGAKP